MNREQRKRWEIEYVQANMCSSCCLCLFRLFCLFSPASQLMTSTASSGGSPGFLISIFQKLFGSQAYPNIVRYNDFSDIAAYFLQKVCACVRVHVYVCIPVCVVDTCMLCVKYDNPWIVPQNMDRSAHSQMTIHGLHSQSSGTCSCALC